MIQNTSEIINVPSYIGISCSFSTKVRHFNETVIEHEENVFFPLLLKNMIWIFNRQINQNL